MATKENDVVREGLDFLTRNGVFAWRANNMGGYKVEKRGFIRGPWTMINGACEYLKGLPDIIGILPNGTILGAEAKVRNHKISPEQEKVETAFGRLGGVYVVFVSAADLCVRINEFNYWTKDDTLCYYEMRV